MFVHIVQKFNHSLHEYILFVYMLHKFNHLLHLGFLKLELIECSKFGRYFPISFFESLFVLTENWNFLNHPYLKDEIVKQKKSVSRYPDTDSNSPNDLRHLSVKIQNDYFVRINLFVKCSFAVFNLTK